VKQYTLTRIPGGALELRAQALVYEKDAKGTNTGASHVETDITSIGYDIGNDSKETASLALAIMRHYYGATDEDAAAEVEAERKAPRFLAAYLLNHQMPPGSKYEISSDILDRFFSL
jgi:hypothetical protein